MSEYGSDESDGDGDGSWIVRVRSSTTKGLLFPY